MSLRPAVRTNFLVFVLFGDIVAPRGGRVWTASLLKMLEVLGVSERAGRSTLSRLRRKGWFKPERDGRHSLYTLTAKARRLLEEGGQRIFEPRHADWNGRWHMVVYSLPESKRSLRNELRGRLSWLGFGRLAPGTWVSAYDRREEVRLMLEDLKADPYAHIFSELQLASGAERDIVRQCWDLNELNRGYARFIARWKPEYEACRQAQGGVGALSPAECFAQRFWITHEYSPFPRLDPNLPSALLPDDWLGTEAAEIFIGYRDLLSPRSEAFVAEALQRPNGQKPN